MTLQAPRDVVGYECAPVDLARFFNFGPRQIDELFEREYLEELMHLPTGERVFRGIPFILAAPGMEKRWIAIGCEPITIPIGATATHIVYAHVCSPLPGQVGRAEFDFWARAGEELGRYTVVYHNGTEEERIVRRRFEVNEWVSGLTPTSFCSVPHATFAPVDWRGPHERQARPRFGPPGSSSMTALPGSWAVNLGGISQAVTDGEATYWLCAVAVGDPEHEISAIRLEGPRESNQPSGLLVGGVTCFKGSADPFQTAPAQTVWITGPGVDPDSSHVAIDLGVHGHPRRPQATVDHEAWLEEPFRGWGDADDAPAREGLVVEVAGTNDATLSVDDLRLSLRTVERDELVVGDYRIRVLPPSLQRVQVSVIDGNTGLPTPSRVHVHSANGVYLPPDGHHHEVNLGLMEDYGADLQLGGVSYAYVNGTFDISLPHGRTFWEIVRGFESTPLRQEVEVGPDTRELRFVCERWSDVRADGWISGDTHVHFVSPTTALLEARAEDVNLVHVLATQWGYLFSSVGDFPFGELVDHEHETAVYVGQEQRQPVLGHMSLLRPRRPIFPLGHGGEPTSPFGSPLTVSMADWADRCRSEGGLVVSPHFPFPYGEIVADVVMEKIDAIEIFGLTVESDGPRIRDYYRLLNCGYQLPLVGGTDKMTSGTPIGAVRTYAQLAAEDEFGFESWARAVRAGRTFQTTGALISIAVEGHTPGETIELPRGGGTLSIEATAAAAHELNRLEVVVNGSPVAAADAGGRSRIELATSISIHETSWVAARCATPYSVRTAFPTAVGGHTSPVYVRCGGASQLNLDDARTLLALIDGGRTWVRQTAVAHESDRARIAAYFDGAYDRLARRIRVR